jgi:O-methyltransferase
MRRVIHSNVSANFAAPPGMLTFERPMLDIHFSKIKWPGGRRSGITPRTWFINRVLRKLGSDLWLQPGFNYREDMVSTEQVVNFQHLIARVLDLNIPGQFVELGCYTGSTSAIIGSLLKESGSDRQFHVYDLFDNPLGKDKRDVLARFVETMKDHGLELPYIHKGDLLKTVPAELPERIAFAHFDLGTGGDPASHRTTTLHCLEHVYDRMSHGAICILMDYHIPGVTIDGADTNPGMKLACDIFFKDKPEKVLTLYGGPCSHGYFKKQ